MNKFEIIKFVLVFTAFLLNVVESKKKFQLEGTYNYQPTWDSLDSRPLPQWYDSAKVGIFLHWGVYSVPSFGSEWFWYNWKFLNTPGYQDFMQKNYKPGFTYQEFARDFTAEMFNATEWVELFQKSGAKYVVLTSKHHEGFTMWPSTYSFGWNAKDVGPHRDLVGELVAEIREKSSLHFGLYYSLFEWFNPLFLQDQVHLYSESNYVNFKMLPELKEIVNRYHPEVIWADGDQAAPASYWKSKEFLAWLYNESPVRDSVVANDRWGMGVMCHHGGFLTCNDHYNPGVLQTRKFENAMSIDKKSWGHRATANLEDFYTTKELIEELVITISCGGNILINAGPNKYGLIDPIFVERFTDLGKWLNINGPAIYNSIPWVHQNDTNQDGVWYTTQRPVGNRQSVFAIVLNYPFTTTGVNLFSLGNDVLDANSEIHLLGYDKNPLIYYKSQESVYIDFPNKQEIDVLGLDFAWTLKIDVPV